MMTLRLAFRNLFGAGLRTWLNVIVLSFAFVVIVFFNGMLDGWNQQSRKDTMDWETGSGQLWHPLYDRYDPYSLQDAHGVVKGNTLKGVKEGMLTPVLVVQATAFPEGHMLNVLLKGIDPGQQILRLPTSQLADTTTGIPVLIGRRMARSAALKAGDPLLVRWRDKDGAFDAREVTVLGIFTADVPTIDDGQIWMSIGKLREMTGMTGEATYLVADGRYEGGNSEGWTYKDLKFLMKDFDQVIEAKKGGSRIVYILLLSIALLAIFDTQVLSVFRRQREIGTYIALGMTRFQVMKLFTIEGSAHSILALILGTLYGFPLLLYFNKAGIPMPKSAGDMGLAITESIIPYYSVGMIVTTVLLVVVSATIVSYFPARRITRMKPTEALKGKMQ